MTSNLARVSGDATLVDETKSRLPTTAASNSTSRVGNCSMTNAYDDDEPVTTARKGWLAQ